MIVLDASCAVEWLLGLPRADDIAERIADPQESLHAPALLAVEVAQVIRRYVAAGDVTAERGGQALEDLADLDASIYLHEPLLPRIWQLRDSVTAYDAAYLSLTEALGAILLTTDRRMANAPGHDAQVEVIA